MSRITKFLTHSPNAQAVSVLPCSTVEGHSLEAGLKNE